MMCLPRVTLTLSGEALAGLRAEVAALRERLAGRGTISEERYLRHVLLLDLARRERVREEAAQDDSDHGVLTRIHAETDPARRKRLVQAFSQQKLGMAHAFARRWRSAGQDHRDIEQAAVLGLLVAIAHFDPARGTGFSSYAHRAMATTILRGPIASQSLVHVPRTVREYRRRVDAAIRSGASLDEAELARVTGLTADQVCLALGWTRDRGWEDVAEPDAAAPVTALDVLIAKEDERMMTEVVIYTGMAGPFSTWVVAVGDKVAGLGAAADQPTAKWEAQAWLCHRLATAARDAQELPTDGPRRWRGACLGEVPLSLPREDVVDWCERTRRTVCASYLAARATHAAGR